MKLFFSVFVGVMGMSMATAAPPDWQELLFSSNPTTQTEWAKHYRSGNGVERDRQRAWQLLCTAALRGYAPAQYEMGQWLMSPPQRQPPQAATWFAMAERRGHPHATAALRALRGVRPVARANCPTGTQVIPLPTPRPQPAPTVARTRVAVQVAPAHIRAKVIELAPIYGLDPQLVLALIQIESNFRVDALSPKNAQGLMQLIPDTATRFGVNDPWDVEQNLRGGMAYLRWLNRRFNGDWSLVLAGYNAGEGAVQRFNGIPPYPETQAYVQKVLSLYQRLQPSSASSQQL